MNIDTPHAGTIEGEADRIIEFPEGLAGFEDLHRYRLYHPQTTSGVSRHFILASVDDPQVAFNIADPGLFGFSYEITLSDGEAAALDLADPSEAAVAVILVKEEADGGMRANLNAPLIFNSRVRRGIQHVFSRLNYQVTLKAQE